MKNSNNSYELTYNGKNSNEEIIKNTNSAVLITSKSFGEPTDNWSNLLIYGDNLPVLKSLLDNSKVYRKVKLIYIDPPYSTKQVFRGKKLQPAYQDQLSGAAYLEFLRKRLILLRELMSNDGSIYVHLDYNMAFQIKLIMDEVFGSSNFRNWITRKKSNQKNYTKNNYGNIQDFILFYSKTDKYTWNKPHTERGIYSLEERFPKIEKETGRRYALVPIHAPEVRNGATGGLWKGKLPPEGKHWMYTPDKLDEFEKKGEIYWSPNGNPRRKIFADNNLGVPVQDIWLDFKDAHNQNIAITGYPTEKNPDILKRIIEASSNEGDIVMDCFSGSGTTISVAEELNRKWIGVDNSKLAIYISLKRILDTKNSDQLRLEFSTNNHLAFKALASDKDTMIDNHNHVPTLNTHLNIDNNICELTIADFESTDPAVKKQRDRGLSLLGLIVLDLNYDGKNFVIHKSFSNKDLRMTLKFNKNDCGNKIGIAIYDIYGNEKLIVKELRSN